MPFELPNLPYAYDALEPAISSRTLELHHDKHHRTYVETLNKLIAGKPLEKESLERVILESARDKSELEIFNNAAQHWNHSFFWHCLKPGGGGKPSGEIARLIDRDFGGYDGFAKSFKEAATKQFGTGWAWLVLHQGKLDIRKTGDADLPLIDGQQALLTLDVWEHAYYLDYQNRRPDFIQAFLDMLLNWDFANQNLANPDQWGDPHRHAAE